MGHRIVISGYYGFDNLGDEAVLFSMLQSLRREIPGLEITVLSNNPAITAREYGVEAVNRWSMRQVADALLRSELLICGGGSLLQDVTGGKSLFYYLGIIWLARMLRRPVMYYAQGIGPVNTPTGRRLVGITTQGVQAITVRDGESLKDLRAMGVQRTVEVTADPVLGLHPGDINLAEGAGILARHGIIPGSPLVGIAVRPIPGRSTWETRLVQVCDNLARAGMQVVFIPMQIPADLILSKRLGAAMLDPYVIIEEKLNVSQMLALVGNLDLLVGMRLHALIFAAVNGVPPLGIVYDPKVERFLNRLGIPHAGQPGDVRSDDLTRMAQNFLASRKELREQISRRVLDLRSTSEQTARIAHQILKGRS
ncbi:colanic acid biosynthesis protein [Sporotomaculum syntrophicum]|uniref:Colanic acid biosynthesis protein n=1 Tax=Sporotomaculum syntrophicum TaxID=182264 RepID=A0A9D2WR26_9FIRM|nr:polysaccharide pyruvyl transferase CsaB [Sporotomaculum syntrophicum]KAF1086072.1 colanic acid biosynthesis protein [Sporotomaculum syntrophicum]